MNEAEMPADWHDQKGWEDYYSNLLNQSSYEEKAASTGSISIDRMQQFIEELKTNNFTDIWVAGCGISMIPKILAKGGLSVHATDISPSAIAFQENTCDPKTEALIEKSGVPASGSGTLTAEVHNFTVPYLKGRFDFILNVKAIQGFDCGTMKQIAKVHFDALKPSGRAIFDTMNVQGDRRDILEESIVEGGFYLPFFESNARYRFKLRETGIPYAFVLGQPIIPRVGEYADDEAKCEKDEGTLRAIAAEFYDIQSAEAETVRKYLADHPETKMASVIYSTG